MFGGIVEHVRQRGSPLVLGRHSLKFDTPVDFLRGTDYDFLGLGMTLEETDPLHGLIHDLMYRRLIKRVAILSHRTVDAAFKFN